MENFSLENGILRFKAGTEIILSESFAERPDIEKVMLPPSVYEIGGAAFAGCENLTAVSFWGEKNLKTICDGAFTLCHALKEYDFNEGLTDIGEMAFWETALSNVTIPESVNHIGDSAFWGCSDLTEFNVLNSSCRLDTDVLGDCGKLKKGFIAPGYHASSYYNQADELNYTLLWLSCPSRHGPSVSTRARKFIKEQELVVMEMILDRNNTAAMTGLVGEGLLTGKDINRYMEEAEKRGLTEIAGLLLETRKTGGSINFEDFAL